MYFDNPPGADHPPQRTESHIHALYVKLFHFIRNLTEPSGITEPILTTLSGLFGADGAVFCYIRDEGASFLAAIGTLSHMKNASFNVNTPKVRKFLDSRSARYFSRDEMHDYIALASNARFESVLLSPIAMDGHPYGLLALASNKPNYFSDSDGQTLYNATIYISTLLKNWAREQAQRDINYYSHLSAICADVMDQLEPIWPSLEASENPEIRTLSSHVANLRDIADFDLTGPLNESVSLETELNEIVKNFRNRLPERIKFSYKIEEGLPSVRGNRELVLAIVREMLANARQAIDNGLHLDDTITFSACDLPGFVVMEISNTGSTVAPADEHRLFEPLFTTWPDHRGLGLPRAKYHALRMNGNLIYRRYPNNINDFRLILPEEAHAPEIEVF